ncbi:MAG: hypothetical protein IT168_19000 [Bryobacterales bacterium]|nr:hypothetical protein [Bryobacterales bacterium]
MKYRVVFAGLFAGLLLKAQIPEFKPPTPLFDAIMRSDTAAATRLLNSGADPNEGRFFGSSALLVAVVQSNEEIVRAMLDRGADVNAKDGHGSTTLMWAVGNESPNAWIVAALIKRGVDVNAKNKMGESALTWAMRRGDMRMVEQLKAAGALDSDTIRKSVENAVATLQKSGPQFVKVSGCVSCHHQSLPQMAYSAARKRGFAVDNAVAEQQVKAVVAMFKPIKEQMANGTVHLPNPGISVGYSLLGLAAEGYQPDELTAAMAKAIVQTQQPDGSFAILKARPPMEASQFTAAALSIRALQIYGTDCEAEIARARQWLAQAKAESQEDRAMKLLGLAWGKADAKQIEQAAIEVIAQQRPDGGWAQLAGRETDAYATGQAVFALQAAASVMAAEKAIQNGITYLLRTQLADGTWMVRTRSSPVQPLKDSGFPHGRDQWISAAGTSWAAMALAYSQPSAGMVQTAGLD